VAALRFKTDENIPDDAVAILRQAGHDAMSIREQGLGGKPDETIARVCRDESRAILTLDLDFADIRNYPPHEYAGIIVLRLHAQDRPHVLSAIERLLPLLTSEPLVGKIWVVDEQAVRVRPGTPPDR
jgi:predicted nuclease of predicted toxin-antitoxin system